MGIRITELHCKEVICIAEDDGWVLCPMWKLKYRKGGSWLS